MGRTRGLSQGEIEKRWRRIEGMTRLGMSAPQICDQLGVSRATVERVRANAGLTRAQHKLTAEEVAKVDRMLADGCSLAEAARTIGTSRSAIWKRFPGRGWTRQQVGEWAALLEQMRASQMKL